MSSREPERSGIAGQSGFTLVELLVTMVIIGVVSLLVVTAMTQAAQTFLTASDESQGLGDAKNVMDQIARDVRQSRGIICNDTGGDDPNCEKHLEVWLDDDSDYAEESDEIVTWELQDSSDGVHFDVVRTDSDGSRTVATSLIVETLFDYNTPGDPENANMVTITMQYDANVGTGTDIRTATTSARIRNG